MVIFGLSYLTLYISIYLRLLCMCPHKIASVWHLHTKLTHSWVRSTTHMKLRDSCLSISISLGLFTTFWRIIQLQRLTALEWNMIIFVKYMITMVWNAEMKPATPHSYLPFIRPHIVTFLYPKRYSMPLIKVRC